MNAALRFSFRNTLHTVCAGFKFKPGIGALADNTGNNFLVATVVSVAGVDDLYLPAF